MLLGLAQSRAKIILTFEKKNNEPLSVLLLVKFVVVVRNYNHVKS